MTTALRILLFAALVLALLFAGAALVWYLAYGISSDPPDRLGLAGLTAPAEIIWGEEGDAVIRAQNTPDALAALGYAHGRRRAWSVALWRQAAAGRLGEWFGEAALPIDRLARHLALAENAQTAYARLDSTNRTLLDAYAAGLDHALRSREVGLEQEFVLLDVKPERWEPWHTLALERLFAWLAAPPPEPSQRLAADSAATSFYEADRALRRWLNLHGFENSIAWAARDSAGTFLFHRLVYGETALPFLFEATLERADSTRFTGASIPGTPFFPAGHAPTHAWALLLTGDAGLTRTAWDSAAVKPAFERIQLKGGEEQLFRTDRMGARLPLTRPEANPADTLAAPDTVWALGWQGLMPASDLDAWLGLLRGEAGMFQLLEGHGLWLQQDGAWRVLGSPDVQVTLPSGVFVGASAWSRYAAELLETQGAAPAALETWTGDAYSVWAAQTAPPLVSALGRVNPDAPLLRDALTYLRNWDFSYDGASIAASIFDTWMAVYRDTTNTFPVVAADSLGGLSRLQYETFEQAVGRLHEAFGPDLSQWRWERAAPARLQFPIWSVEELQEQLSAVRGNRFAPLERPGRGHPTALAWGPSPIQQALAAPAAWEAWVRTDAWDAFTVRRRFLAPDAPLGRYRASDRPPLPIRLPDPAAVAGTTTLVPAGP